MSTELSIYDRITDPMVAVKQLGHSISASKIFGSLTPTQGEVLALDCLARRVPPLMLAERYHLIHDRLSMKAEAMSAGFEDRGGKCQLIERTPDRVALRLIKDGVAQEFSLTWQEALQEPFVYEAGKGVTEAKVIEMIEAGNPPPLKPKYRTPRSRMQMLWARLVSDSVRAVDPGVVCGTYTPEEIDDLPENGAKSPQAAPAAVSEPAEGEVVDAEFEVTDDPAKGEKLSGMVPMCSAAESSRIKELWGELGVTPEARTKQLHSRGVDAVRSLTSTEAQELIGKLQAVLDKRKSTDEPSEPKADPAPAEPKSGLSDIAIVVEIRERLKAVEQAHPGSAAKVKAKLLASGLSKLDQLGRSDALNLLNALKGSDLEKYLGIAIWQPVDPSKN